MKLNLGSGRYPLDGFENLNEPDWMAEGGLADYDDNSVEAITISHLLMYLKAHVVLHLVEECYRVLDLNGILRITEDETFDPKSSRRGGQPGAIYLTSSVAMVKLLNMYGFVGSVVDADQTYWVDDSLIQQFHGEWPDVFHVEGMR